MGPVPLGEGIKQRRVHPTDRGFEVDHSTNQRWVVHFSPELEKAFHKKKKRPGNRWRLNKTYIKVNVQWKYFY